LQHGALRATFHDAGDAARARGSASGARITAQSGPASRSSTWLVSKWIDDEHFSTVIPSAPKITNGKVVARSNGVTVS
jgi:hypothetical protein